MNSIFISIFCVVISVFIFYTQSDFSGIQLQSKDASLLLLLFALLAYVNKQEIIFLLLLSSFLIVYVLDTKTIKKYCNPIFMVLQRNKNIEKEEKKEEITENTNEITIDDDIEIDDEITEVEKE